MISQASIPFPRSRASQIPRFTRTLFSQIRELSVGFRLTYSQPTVLRAFRLLPGQRRGKLRASAAVSNTRLATGLLPACCPAFSLTFLGADRNVELAPRWPRAV